MNTHICTRCNTINVIDDWYNGICERCGLKYHWEDWAVYDDDGYAVDSYPMLIWQC